MKKLNALVIFTLSLIILIPVVSLAVDIPKHPGNIDLNQEGYDVPTSSNATSITVEQNSIEVETTQSSTVNASTIPEKDAYNTSNITGTCSSRDSTFILASKWEKNNTQEVTQTNFVGETYAMGDYEYQCAIRKNDSKLYCWGTANSRGKQGVGNKSTSEKPRQVDDDHNYTQVSPYYYNTCGIREDGTATCWGRNDRGQLGDGSTSQRLSPKEIDDSNKYIDISPGLFHSCGVRKGGQATCWGLGTIGRMGDGTSGGYITSPVEVAGNYTFVDVDVGGYHACGITDKQNIYCWGGGGKGQLGYGGTGNKDTPTKIDSDKTFKDVSANFYHTCAVSTDNKVYCWGEGEYGKLGTGSTSNEAKPTKVNTSRQFTSIETGFYNTCATTIDGQLSCWGLNSRGEIGDGTFTDRTSPSKASFNKPLQSVHIQTGKTCGLDAETGKISCFGSQASFEKYHVTKPYLQNRTFTDLALAARSACGKHNGSYYCWGQNDYYQTGRTDTLYSEKKNKITYGSPLQNVSGISKTYCGIRENDSKPVCWGDNEYNQYGDGTDNTSATPIQVDTDKNITKVRGSFRHSCGLTSKGAVLCWGENTYNQFGDGSTTSTTTPTTAAGGLTFEKVAFGGFSGCGVRNGTNHVMCWGSNNYGQIGDGSGTDRSTPVNISDSSEFKEIFAGGWHKCGIRKDNKTVCWGLNQEGQLGDGTTTDRSNPKLVDTDKEFTTLSLTRDNTCGLTKNKTAYCWGRGNRGQLGKDIEGSATPVKIPVNESIKEIKTGEDFTCTTTVSNKTYCFGENNFGQLGKPFSDPLTPGQKNFTFTPERKIDSSNLTSTILENETEIGESWKYSCQAINSSTGWSTTENITIHDGPEVKLSINEPSEHVLKQNDGLPLQLNFTCYYDTCTDINYTIYKKDYYGKKDTVKASNKTTTIARNGSYIVYTANVYQNVTNLTITRNATKNNWIFNIQNGSENLTNYTINYLELNRYTTKDGVELGQVNDSENVVFENNFSSKPIVLVSEGTPYNITNTSFSINTAHSTYLAMNQTGLENLNLSKKSNKTVKDKPFTLLQSNTSSASSHTDFIYNENSTHITTHTCDGNSSTCSNHTRQILQSQKEPVVSEKDIIDETNTSSKEYYLTQANASCLKNMTEYSSCSINQDIIIKDRSPFSLYITTQFNGTNKTQNLSTYTVEGNNEPDTEGFTTNLSKPEEWDNTSLTLEKQDGKISWDNPVNISSRNFTKHVNVEENKIQVDTEGIGQGYDTEATLTFRGITWEEPILLKDGRECEDCEIVSYQDNTVTAKVSGFTTYTTEEGEEERDYDYSSSSTKEKNVKLPNNRTINISEDTRVYFNITDTNYTASFLQENGTTQINVSGQTYDVRNNSVTIKHNETTDVKLTISRNDNHIRMYRETITKTATKEDVPEETTGEKPAEEESNEENEPSKQEDDTNELIYISIPFMIALLLLWYLKKNENV